MISNGPKRWLWLLLAIPLVIGLLRLRFDVDVLNLLPDESPAVQGLKLYQQHFAAANELVVTLGAAEADTAADAARSLASHLREQRNLVRDAVWQPPWLESPAESAELIAYLWLNQPAPIFSELTNRFAPTNLLATLNATRERLATTLSPHEMARLPYDPLGLMELPANRSTPTDVGGYMQGDEMFSSADATFRIMFVQAASELKNYREAGAWLDRVRGTINAWQTNAPQFASVAINLTGAPAFTAEISRGMERDTRGSVLGTMAVITLLFWFAHRRFRPLLWLIAMMVLIVAATMALAGLLVGTLNVVSIGFASILLALGVDYAVVLYQEWRSAPHLSVAEVRKEIGPSIVWSAVTTAGAFALLNLGGLPGLATLGTIVALGTGLAAVVMMYVYLPRAAGGERGESSNFKVQISNPRAPIIWIGWSVFAVAAIATLSMGFPKIDSSAEPLRPRKSAAYDAMDEIQRRMGPQAPATWVLFAARNIAELETAMKQSEPTLEKAVADGAIRGFQIPLGLLPNATNQATNRPIALWLAAQRSNAVAAASQAGFAKQSLAMTERILATWNQAGSSAEAFWPTNRASRWLTEKVLSAEGGHCLAVGMVQEAEGANDAKVERFSNELQHGGALLAGWHILGRALMSVVKSRIWTLALPMLGLVVVSLWLAFRNWLEVALALGSLTVAIFGLLTIMRWLGWSWNLMNLMALPLLFGMSIDYSIHVQSSLRRHGGNLAETHCTIGRALWLCGGTTIAGFGSLAWSGNAGLASLGLVCATGNTCALITALYLLPHMWLATIYRFGVPPSGGSGAIGRPPEGGTPNIRVEQAPVPIGPSALYRTSLWQAGLTAARVLPENVCATIARRLVAVYAACVPARRKIVTENLLIPLGGDSAKARQMTRRLFDNFAVKLVDLWRFELGKPVDTLLVTESGWKHFETARMSGRGVLVVTPHLGNWEFGGPLLIKRGLKLHVVTLVEPGRGFTELRRDARASWGISTIILGDNPFSFIEVIKLLEAGEVVAMLIDRPPPSSAVTVELFGQAFQASIAAAELARASGCAILPVYLPRVAGGYAAHVLPEVDYDRASLNKREARAKLTQRILRAFEPVVHQHLDQWYHFVPLWQRENGK